MVKVNQIVRFSPQRAARHAAAVLTVAGIAVVLFGGPQPALAPQAPRNAPVLQVPVLYELPPLRAVSDDKEEVTLEIFIEPHTPADLQIIRRREPVIKEAVIRWMQHPAEGETSVFEPESPLKPALLEQIRTAAAPAGIDNIYFNRIQP